MATRRIKDITNTATTFASDDFIALDGSTQGTRKMDKDDLIAEVSAGVSGDYLEEANNLSDVASLDTSKLNMEIPDVGSAGNEVSLNSMLGTMAFQDADGVSMGDVEAESLEVTGTITTKDVGGVTQGQVEFQDSSYTISGGSNLGDIRHKAPRHRFYTGSTVLAQIDEGTSYFTNTNVGIGTASPSSLAPAANNLVVGSGSGNEGLTIFAGSANEAAIYFADGTTGNEAYRSYIVCQHASDNLVFGTAGATRWTINSSGNLVANGTAIDFGSGATLSDYEEGTHTTAATPSSSGTITLDASSNSLSYTRVGRKITVSGALGVSAVSSPVGNYINFTLPLQIADLDELSGHFAGSCVVLNAAGSMGSYSIIGLDGESSFRLYKNTNTSAVATAPDFSGDETIYVSVTYFTTA